MFHDYKRLLLTGFHCISAYACTVCMYIQWNPVTSNSSDQKKSFISEFCLQGSRITWNSFCRDFEICVLKASFACKRVAYNGVSLYTNNTCLCILIILMFKELLLLSFIPLFRIRFILWMFSVTLHWTSNQNNTNSVKPRYKPPFETVKNQLLYQSFINKQVVSCKIVFAVT